MPAIRAGRPGLVRSPSKTASGKESCFWKGKQACDGARVHQGLRTDTQSERVRQRLATSSSVGVSTAIHHKSHFVAADAGSGQIAAYRNAELQAPATVLQFCLDTRSGIQDDAWKLSGCVETKQRRVAFSIPSNTHGQPPFQAIHHPSKGSCRPC